MPARRLAVAAVVAVLVAGCSRPPTASPADPGGRRLRALVEDPAVDVAPDGAERVDEGSRVALEGRPSVVWREYRSQRPLGEVFAFYRRELARRDWRFRRERRLSATGDGFAGARVAEFAKEMGGWVALLVVERHEGEEGRFRVLLTAPQVESVA